VRAAPVNYDVIVADNFHPARSGAGALYTVEHFQAVRGRLAPQGLFCQWLPLHQLDLATLRSIVRSFMAVYPQGYALLATNSLQTPVLGLVGSADGGRKLDPAALHARMAHEGGWPFPLATFGLPDALSVLGGIVAGPQALARFGAPAPLNTDDHPVVAYLAPRITYAPDSTPGERLLALLSALQVNPGEVLAAGTDFDARLAAYWQARDRFLAAGRDVQPSADVRRMLAQVGTPLLQVLQASPDFRPAYEPLLRMAQAVAAEDPAEARRWLQALASAAPQRPEAGEALQVLAR
jgi:spermidine synthase